MARNSDEFRQSRRRLADRLSLIGSRVGDRQSVDGGTPRRACQVYDGGALPSFVPAVFWTYAVAVSLASETEGAGLTVTPDTGETMPVLVWGPGVPGVGDRLKAKLIQGIWQAEHNKPSSGTTVHLPNCFCDQTPVSLAFTMNNDNVPALAIDKWFTNFGVGNDTLTWQAVPSSYVPFTVDGVHAFLGATTYIDNNPANTTYLDEFRLLLQCIGVGQEYVIYFAFPSTILGPLLEARGGWLAGTGLDNQCSPFHLHTYTDPNGSTGGGGVNYDIRIDPL